MASHREYEENEVCRPRGDDSPTSGTEQSLTTLLTIASRLLGGIEALLQWFSLVAAVVAAVGKLHNETQYQTTRLRQQRFVKQALLSLSHFLSLPLSLAFFLSFALPPSLARSVLPCLEIHK